MSLQVWLPLNGNLNNLGLSNSIAINSGATVDNSGKIGKCYSLANGNYIGFDASNINKHKYLNFSLTIWVYLTLNDNTERYILGCWESGGCGFCWQNLKVDFSIYSNGYKQAWSNVISLNTWHHIAGTFDSKELKLYVDGLLLTTTGVNGLITYNATTPWEIGGNPGPGAFASGNLVGKLNDVRIYDHCLSEKEVKELSKCLVLHYSLSSGYIESTTNLVPNSDTFSGWSSYTNGYTSITNNDFGTKSVIITNKQSWCGIYRSITLPHTGTYTISVYCKPISRTYTSINQTLYTSGGGLGDTNVAISWDKPGEWLRISMTKTYTTTSITLYLIAFGGSNSSGYNVSCEYTMPQIEEKDHATPYTSSSRLNNVIQDSSGYNNNGIINGTISINGIRSPRYLKCADIPVSTTITHNRAVAGDDTLEWTCCAWVYMRNYSSGTFLNNFNSGNRLCHSSSPLLYLNSGSYDYYIYGNALETNTWIHIAFVFRNSDHLRKIYRNGIDISTQGPLSNHPSGISNVVTLLSNFDGYISDYREYATALTTEDIKELYEVSLSVDRNGNVYAYEFIEE